MLMSTFTVTLTDDEVMKNKNKIVSVNNSRSGYDVVFQHEVDIVFAALRMYVNSPIGYGTRTEMRKERKERETGKELLDRLEELNELGGLNMFVRSEPVY